MNGNCWSGISRYVGAAADLLLPRHCCICGRELGVYEKTACAECLADMPLTWHWTMPQNDMADRFNAWITDEAIPYVYAAALFRFDKENNYRNICYSLKYKRDIGSGRFFSRMLAIKLKEATWFADVDAVVPVPLHWTRKLARGYNQAEVIAGAIAMELGAVMLPDLLVRKRRTRSQTKLGIEGKKANVADAFAVNVRRAELYRGRKNGKGAQKPFPRHILLVDDLFTTGATMFNCHKALRLYFGNDVKVSIASLGAV